MIGTIEEIVNKTKWCTQVDNTRGEAIQMKDPLLTVRLSRFLFQWSLKGLILISFKTFIRNPRGSHHHRADFKMLEVLPFNNRLCQGVTIIFNKLNNFFLQQQITPNSTETRVLCSSRWTITPNNSNLWIICPSLSQWCNSLWFLHTIPKFLGNIPSNNPSNSNIIPILNNISIKILLLPLAHHPPPPKAPSTNNKTCLLSLIVEKWLLPESKMRLIG